MKADRKSASDIYEEHGVPPRTQRDMYTKNLDNDRHSGQARRGRPPKIDQDTVYKMERYIQGRYRKRTLDWEGLGIETGAPGNKRIIKRRINNAGYKKCRVCQKK